MRVDPTDAASIQATLPHERYDVGMWDDRRLVHLRIIGQQLLAATLITDEEFAVHEIMATHFVTAQEAVELDGVRWSIRKETDPDRSIDQDDHAAEGFAGDARSRRRGVARARGSDPRSALSRSYALRRTNASKPRRTVSVSVVAPQAVLASRKRLSSM